MFFLASLVGVVFLYLVGFLILKGFKFSNLFALAAAPIVSTLCFEILAIVFDMWYWCAVWTKTRSDTKKCCSCKRAQEQFSF